MRVRKCECFALGRQRRVRTQCKQLELAIARCRHQQSRRMERLEWPQRKRRRHRWRLFLAGSCTHERQRRQPEYELRALTTSLHRRLAIVGLRP